MLLSSQYEWSNPIRYFVTLISFIKFLIILFGYHHFLANCNVQRTDQRGNEDLSQEREMMIDEDVSLHNLRLKSFSKFKSPGVLLMDAL